MARSLYAALGAAADDPVVAPVLARVAQRRVAYLAQCYRELGVEEKDAAARALLAYAAYRGLLQLAREAPTEVAVDAGSYASAAVAAHVPTAASGVSPRRRRS